MNLLDITALPVITENAFREAEAKSGVGRTAKIVDATTITEGQIKQISFTFRPNMDDVMAMIGNCVGLAPEATDEILIPYNYTPPTVTIGDTDTDNTGTFTFALVSPVADQTRVMAGCVVRSVRVYASAGQGDPRFLCDVVADTKVEIAENQATPGTMSAYSEPSSLNIYSFCNTSTYNEIDVNLNSVDLLIEGNPYIGGHCSTDYLISRGVPEIAVTGSLVFTHDSNTLDAYQDALTVAEAPIVLSNGQNLVITIADTVATGDIPYQDVDGITMFTVPFKAIASTSGNLAEVEFKETVV
jgi:hypothetical protein